MKTALEEAEHLYRVVHKMGDAPLQGWMLTDIHFIEGALMQREARGRAAGNSFASRASTYSSTPAHTASLALSRAGARAADGERERGLQ